MKKLYFLFLMLVGFYAAAQQANDCSNAIVVCGNTNISSNVSGFGIQELDATVNPCESEEVNSLWLSVNIAVGGTLAFTIRPDSNDLEVDYDFYVFGPNTNCTNFNDPIRCNTTNPLQADLSSNMTGLRASETDPTGGPGVLGNGFVSSIPVVASEQYYILIDRPIGNGGFNLEWTGTAGFLPSPEVNQPQDLEFCSDQSNIQVDLTLQEGTITSSTTAIITYYTSYADAFDANNRIADPAQYEYSENFTNIFVRVNNPNGCFEIVDFEISSLVFDDPPIFLDYILCDSDRNGTEDFEIAQIKTQVESFISNIMEFSVSLHPNETDAIANTNSITDATYTVANSTNIYARIISALDENCFITYPIGLSVIEDPYPASINLVQCDIDETNSLDGITRMDLEQAFLEFPNVQVSYYETVNDRNTDNPIINPQDFMNRIPFNDTVYYKIESGLCISAGEITLEINPTTVSLNTTSPIIQCGGNEAFGASQSTFDIESIRQASYAGLDVAFYANRTDLALEQNPLAGNFITESTTLYIRIETSNECQGVEEIELVVNPLPKLEFESVYQVCTDGELTLIEAPAGFDSYTWYQATEDTLQQVGNEAQILISEEGSYQLEVSIIYENNGQTVTCYAASDFIVEPSNRATIEQIDIEGASDSNAVEILVSGDGDYEFSIDNETYQNENLFENVDAGFITVYVRDKNGCGISEREIAVIGFPKFFTPNDDGVNEYWQIIGANEGLLTAMIAIYDRYGKLVSQFDMTDNGWDGTLNGSQLPASDYWFKVNFSDGKQFQGHFSLKR